MYQSSGEVVPVWRSLGEERMVVDVTGARPCTSLGNRRYPPAATGRPHGEELPQTSPEVVATLQQRGGKTPATWRTVSRWRGSDIDVEDEAEWGG